MSVFRFSTIKQRPVVSGLLIVMIGVSIIAVIYILNYRAELRQLREAKREVISWIRVGDQIEAAQAEITQRGFELVYDEPIDQTGLGEYVTQGVIVGEIKQSELDTFLYVIDSDIPSFFYDLLGWESSYVFIYARPNGEIYKVE